MIIGLTGKNGSGKGVIADFLVGCGFQYYSLSDVLRDEIKKSGKNITREALIEMGRSLREEHGPSALADLVLKRLDIEKNYVIDSIRNPAEVKALKKRQDFFLINVEADQKTRFERVKTRARENDPSDFDKFIELENKELQNVNPAGQQLLKTAALADTSIDNNESIPDLSDKIRALILDLNRNAVRPDWDEYFMGIAKVAALRSNCIKRKVAAVIVRDKRIISTGYNGTPRGIKNCAEGGCPRCNSFGNSGANLDECLCSHAEENAIVQAAFHGASVKDATLYTTFSPCLMCTKMIINSGIKEVVFNAIYPMGALPLKLLSQAYLQVRQVKSDE